MTKRKEQLEKRKRQLWVYLLGYYVDWNFMPTLREMADNAFGEDKLSYEGARYILRLLEKDGRIKINPRKRRGIELIEPKKEGGESNGN